MPFHRFEDIDANYLTPHLSTGKAPIIEGLGECYYPIIDKLDAPAASGNREGWIEGNRLAFGFIEYLSGYARPPAQAVHEEFIYVLSGGLDIRIGNESRSAGPGDVIEIPKGTKYGFTVTGEAPLRYALVRSTPYLEARIEA